MQYGFHIPKENTFLNTYKAIEETGLNTSQIYVSNGRSYNPPKPVLQDLLATRKYLERINHTPYVHGKLLYNLAGCVEGKKTDPSKYKSMLHLTKTGVEAELDIASMLGGSVVVHTGSCKDKKEGIETIVDTLYKVLTEDSIFTEEFEKSKINCKVGRKLLLENSAGEGNKFGSTLSELETILTKFDQRCDTKNRPELKKNLGLCLDTAHIHGAGFCNLSNKKGVVKFFEDIEDLDILNRLDLIHLNDSKVQLGSKKDRHAVLGEGTIWSTEESKEGLRELLEISNDYKIDLIGEPNDRSERPVAIPSGNCPKRTDDREALSGEDLLLKYIEEINEKENFRC